MIKHVVMMKFAEHAENADKAVNIEKAKSMLELLPTKIEQIKNYEVGIDILKTDRSFDIVLISEFNSVSDLNDYINHPAHQEVLAFISKVREETKVVDFEF